MPSGSKRYDITALAYNKRGKLLAIGRNSYVKTHPLQAKYGARAGKPKAIYLHAEMDALIKSKGKAYRLVVLRYDNKGRPVNSKPCPSCQLAIRDFKVYKVEHT